MAKAKNIGSVDDIIISDDEQLYEVPSNWAWVKLGGIAAVKGGKRVPKGKKLSDDKTEHPYIRVTDMSNGTVDLADIKYVDDEIFSVIHNYTISSKDVYISVAGSIGKIGIIPECLEGANLTENAAKITNIIGTDNKYIMMYLQSDVAQLQMMESTISTTQPKLALFRIENINVPLPPLAEQKRIVEQIENLFAKLDEATEKAQGVVEQFELHKESILHQAFSGYLSEKWRIENGISADSWEQTSLGTYLNPMKTRKPKGETFRYIDIDAIDNKKQVIREAKETPVSEAPSRASRAVNSGDVLFSMVRPYLKNIAYVTEDMSDCIASTGFYVCSCKDGLYSKYLYELLRSKDAIDYLMQFMKGDNSPSIRKDDLLDMPLRLPCIDEQKEICQIVSSLLQKEEEAKEAAVKVIDQIDLMKKSILAKAFRGELGTNNSEEESSVELLKQIIAE